MSDAQGSRSGTMFGPYRLKRLLGRGGMGEVYEAEHTVKQWTVALKLMSHTFSQDPVFRKRMEREARITGRLLEPHVVPIHDYGEIDGQLYLEMRLIEGVDLDSLLEREGPLPAPRAVAIIHQVASALDAAHTAGVTHRDVKPQNILITGDDFAYLVDFGIASAKTDEKLTQLGTAVGTLKYMAPERFSSDEVTSRADVYALACVLYECLTGAPPYGADSTGMLVTAHMMQPIPKPSVHGAGVSPAFDAVIAAGMAKDPTERYATAGALAAAAHKALSSPERERAETILQRSDTSGELNALLLPPGADVAISPPGRPRRSRTRWPMVAAAAVVAVAIGAVGVWLVLTPTSQRQHRVSSGKTAPPSAAAPSGDQARLISLLPPGYLPGTCTPATPESGSIWVTAAAMVTCGQNTQPGGPARATYALFPTPDRLKRAFNDDIGNVSLVNCPGEGRSPVSWHYDETPNDMAGLIACGTYNNHPNVIWSNDARLMLSDVTGDPATVEDLHTWWDAYG
ncbi:serine/threonine-protein kinase [Mycobacterium sp. 852002-40037_SCH5390672]|uniref:serine/threonine-protein kinase n=1 Tax=Mycobacterium sp. 852002-40037_SCH5390672 TaxID=1834089 RepID=UPI0008055A16|nr:serine/threonine-protein kinase [Mycobacterium sp. 852002-40037_SCH5390672]OBB94858.1 serine/threonine protein kinase [Mycobacterium sp. 852002-40037_SCH5390672]